MSVKVVRPIAIKDVVLPDGKVRSVTYNPQMVIPLKDLDMSFLVQANKQNELVVDEDDLPIHPTLFWRQLPEDGSWYSEKFGHRYPAVVVEKLMDGRYLYRGDALLRVDGPCQPYGSANPSAVGVAYRIDDQGQVWYRGFLGYRSTIEHPYQKDRNGKPVKGVITLQIFGGYSLGGEDPKNAALRQALEEGGAILKNIREVGAGSSNRMDTETCIRVFLAEYDINPNGKKDDTAQGYEAILGDFEFRADQFPSNVCFDFIVAAAFQYANTALGLISSSI